MAAGPAADPRPGPLPSNPRKPAHSATACANGAPVPRDRGMGDPKASRQPPSRVPSLAAGTAVKAEKTVPMPRVKDFAARGPAPTASPPPVRLDRSVGRTGHPSFYENHRLGRSMPTATRLAGIRLPPIAVPLANLYRLETSIAPSPVNCATAMARAFPFAGNPRRTRGRRRTRAPRSKRRYGQPRGLLSPRFKESRRGRSSARRLLLAGRPPRRFYRRPRGNATGFAD